MTQKATFAAGCFWGVEAVFRRIRGVLSTQVGYAGGFIENPSYRDVRSGKTGHAESVMVEYDPDVISYDELLEVFWEIHNPTSINRQGPDAGTQYRSAIFYHSEAQRMAAWKSKARLEGRQRFSGRIATEIAPLGRFYQAEDYHQRYYEKQGILH